MKKVSSPRIRSLLRQAENVYDNGKRAAAEQLYRQIIDEAPEVAAGWVGLGRVVRETAEKQAAFEQALVLEPKNESARHELDVLLGVAEPEPAEKVDRARLDDNRDWREPETLRERFDAVDDAGASPAPDAAIAAPEAAEHDHAHAASDGVVDHEAVCYRHPQRKTSLRCYSCGKPICGSCAQHTPVGYRCKTCIREAQDVFYQATAVDYVLALIVALPLGILGGLFVPQAGFFVIFLGAAAGSVIGRLVHRVVGRRRGRYMPYLVAGCVIAGGLLSIIGGNFIWGGLYLFLAVSSAFYMLR